MIPLALRDQVCKMSHENMAHAGRDKILSTLIRYAYWRGMAKDVTQYLCRCIKCKRRKVFRPLRAGAFKKIQCLSPGDVYHADYLCGKLPESTQGYVHALIVIDGFTRFPWIVPLRDKKPVTIADGLFEHIFSIVGLPKRFHCDNDFTLTSEVLEILFLKWHVKQTFISFRHPCGNGVVERSMRYINTALTLTLPVFLNGLKLRS